MQHDADRQLQHQHGVHFTLWCVAFFLLCDDQLYALISVLDDESSVQYIVSVTLDCT